MNLIAGTALQNGKYVLNHPLGQSALGLTFRATHVRSHQTIVLKTLRSQPQTDMAHLKRRFVEEARRLAQCQHPGLVRVLDVFEEAGLPFVVMDYVTGETLAERVRSRGALPEAEAVQYIRQAGSALSVMHRQGLLHRDIKPENLVRPKGASFVVLVGLGIAHYTVLGVPDSSEAVVSPYAALELHQRQVNLTAATDVYALAATLYFLVTGQEPIAADRRSQSTLPSPRQLQPQLSGAIEQAILSGMAINPQERPQTVAAWLSRLPDSNPPPAAQEFTHGVEQPRAAVNLPQTTASSNGSARPTAPPAPALVTTAPTHAPAPPTRLPTPSPTIAKSRFPKVLIMTSVIAIAAGSGLGLALRFSAAHGIGPTFFQTQQDFPPVQNWPLQASPIDLSTAPPPPEPAPMRSFVPDRLPKTKVLPSPTPTPPTPAPLPTETIEAKPSPAPSAISPGIPPAPLPSPELPTNPTPRPIPSGQAPANSQGLPRL